MPLLVPPPVVAPEVPEYAPPSIAVTIITDPAGKQWILDGSARIWLQPGRRGFHAPSYQHYRDSSPAVDGAFWRGVRATERELFIPIVIIGHTRAELLTTRRSLIAAISPKRGECVITSAYPDGSLRHINGRYIDGMEGEEGKGAYGVLVMRYGLRFVADEPYMYGEERTEEWASDAPGRNELPIPGADTFYEVVSAAQVLGQTTVTNPGDVDAYPLWTFSGPFSAITLTNNSTGKTLTLTHSAAGASDTITIDTRPGQTQVIDEAGANQWSALSAGYSLWPLVPGINELNIAVTGTTALTRAAMSYRPRYEAA